MPRSLAPSLLTAFALAAALAAPAFAADGQPAGVGLFSRSEDSPVVVTPGIWLTHGFAQTVTESENSGKIKQGANLMATADLDLRLPGRPWLGLWARGGTTVANRKAESDTADNIDSDFTLGEANVVLTLAGRGSPFFESEEYPRSTLDLYAGGRYFRERYDADLVTGVRREVDARWVGPQIGMRGEWYLQDTYDLDALRGWSLTLRGAVMPWMQMDSTDRRDGVKAFELESNRAYGGDAAAGLAWRRGPIGFGLGFEAQFLRADSGHEEDAFGTTRSVLEARSNRYGAFLTLSINF